MKKIEKYLKWEKIQEKIQEKKSTIKWGQKNKKQSIKFIYFSA